jgi:hypothetical protein
MHNFKHTYFWILLAFFFTLPISYLHADLTKVTDENKTETVSSASLDSEEALEETKRNFDEAFNQESSAIESQWSSYPPQVKIEKMGDQVRLTILPHDQMPEENKLAILSMRLLNEKEEILGIKTFDATNPDRSAEFVVGPNIAKDKVKLFINSELDGDWSQDISLEPTNELADSK